VGAASIGFRWLDLPLHNTGEGQRGDQEMKSGNGAIFRHKEDGRALRVFEAPAAP
jgi:hypothetical protein